MSHSSNDAWVRAGSFLHEEISVTGPRREVSAGFGAAISVRKPDSIEPHESSGVSRADTAATGSALRT